MYLRGFYAESDEIVTAVRKKGLPVDYVVFQDEGHGFVKKANQIKGYRTILDFLNSCLRNEQGSSSPKTRRQSFPYGSAYVGRHPRQPAEENEPGCSSPCRIAL